MAERFPTFRPFNFADANLWMKNGSGEWGQRSYFTTPTPYSPLFFSIRNPRLFCYTLIRLLRSRPGDRPRLGDFKSLSRFEIARNVGGKSEHHRTAGWLTARRGDPTE